MPQFPSYLPYPPHGAPDAPQSGQGDPGGSPDGSDLRSALAQPSRLAQQEQFLLRGGGGVAAPRTLLDAPPASPRGPLGLGAPGGPLGLGHHLPLPFTIQKPRSVWISRAEPRTPGGAGGGTGAGGAGGGTQGGLEAGHRGPPTSGGLGSPQGTMNQLGHQGGPPVSVGNASGVSAVGNLRGARAPPAAGGSPRMMPVMVPMQQQQPRLGGPQQLQQQQPMTLAQQQQLMAQQMSQHMNQQLQQQQQQQQSVTQQQQQQQQINVQHMLAQQLINQQQQSVDLSRDSSSFQQQQQRDSSSSYYETDKHYRLWSSANQSSGAYSQQSQHESFEQRSTSAQQSSYNQSSQQQKSQNRSKLTVNLDPVEWDGCLEEDVIPYDVDGLRKFKIPCDLEEMMNVSRDGRPWKKWVTSGRKGFDGRRRIAHCKGSPICYSKSCEMDGIQNRVQFTVRGEERPVCVFCSRECETASCAAHKVWEHSDGAVIVYHVGFHTCVAKKKASVMKARELMGNHLAVRPALAVNEEMSKVLREENIDWARFQEIAQEYVNKKTLYNAKSHVKQTIDSHGHSFDAVCLFKKKTDVQDRYLIYRLNNQDMNNGHPSYVFKSSTASAQLAISMDRESGENRDCYAHADVKHDRVNGLQTVTLWMFHKHMAKIMCIAVMDITKENAENLTLFWSTLNDMLQEISGDSSYQFNPKG